MLCVCQLNSIKCTRRLAHNFGTGSILIKLALPLLYCSNLVVRNRVILYVALHVELDVGAQHKFINCDVTLMHPF